LLGDRTAVHRGVGFVVGGRCHQQVNWGPAKVARPRSRD
jgi:hypothetical protein